jgi:NADH-quinone oxidoreductase subunit H
MVDLPPDPISMTIAIMTSPLFLKIAIFPGLTSIGIIAAILTWFDRKVTARVQLRIGPQYASPFGGILQSFADLIKLAFKELIIPEKADTFFFILAPVFGLVLGAGLIALIPFSPETLVSNVEVGLPVFLAFLTLSPTLVLLAGWSANSKYPFIGGLRSLFQQTGYEIPLWLSSIGVVMMAGSFNLTKIVQAQSTGWFIIPQLLGALIFLITSVAEQERIPFDLPEAEPEIIMGWQAEYPGFLFLAAQGAGFIKLYAFSALFATIYLGGYLGPGPQILGLFWSLLKTVVIIFLVILLRGTFGRVRLDQLLKYGWTLLLGLAIVNIAITYFIVVGIPSI